MESYSYFPTLVYREERPDLIGQVFPFCNQKLDEVREELSTVCQSENLRANEEMKEISKYLLASAVDILRSQGYSVEQYEFLIEALWAQELHRGSMTNVHVHKNSQISGWFFLSGTEDGAYPIYHDTRMNKSMVELDFARNTEVVAATDSIHFNNMAPGTVLFSNSWASHQLGSGSSETTMKCIHFVISHKDKSCST